MSSPDKLSRALDNDIAMVHERFVQAMEARLPSLEMPARSGKYSRASPTTMPSARRPVDSGRSNKAVMACGFIARSMAMRAAGASKTAMATVDNVTRVTAFNLAGCCWNSTGIPWVVAEISIRSIAAMRMLPRPQSRCGRVVPFGYTHG